MRLKRFLALGLVLGLASLAFGLRSILDHPSIAIPINQQTKEDDSVARSIYEVLCSHSRDFTGGMWVNGRSELNFAGGVEGVNALMGDLAKVKGATIRVRLSKEAGVTHWAVNDAPPNRPCDCRLDHDVRADAHAVTLTIYLGGDRVDVGKLEFPAIGKL